MGHSIHYMDFARNTTIEEMLAARSIVLEDEGERDGGYLMSHDSGFKLHENIICESYDEAVDKINELDRGRCDDHGVLYKEYKGKSKAMQNTLDRRAEVGKKKAEYISENHVQNRKSESVTCPKCKSRLTISYLKSDYCPLCREDLRSETVRNRIKAFDKKIAELDKKYAELERKQKFEVRWLVKLEFHV